VQPGGAHVQGEPVAPPERWVLRRRSVGGVLCMCQAVSLVKARSTPERLRCSCINGICFTGANVRLGAQVLCLQRHWLCAVVVAEPASAQHHRGLPYLHRHRCAFTCQRV